MENVFCCDMFTCPTTPVRRFELVIDQLNGETDIRYEQLCAYSHYFMKTLFICCLPAE